MDGLLPGVIVLLLALILVLCAKIRGMRAAAREIAQALGERLETDTNTLITVSTRDSAMRALAADINVQLRQLRRLRHRYEQGDRELKEAITNVSHDLRTPLTAMSGYLDLLVREEVSGDAQRYIAQIANRVQALRRLTEELFGYSVAASRQALSSARVDVVRALEESLLSFYALMQQRGIQPQIRLPQTPVYRELDECALGRIFANIIGNALKYSDGDLSVDMEESGLVTFSNAACGLDSVTAGRLFDRFYTVQDGRGGTGLGLSIARLLTERMGGSIRAAYSEGRLVIQVAFPAATAEKY